MHGNKPCRDDHRWLCSQFSFALSCSASAENTTWAGSELPADQFVRRIVANKLNAEQQDQSHRRCRYPLPHCIDKPPAQFPATWLR